MIYNYFEPAKNVYKPWIPVKLNFKKTHKVTSNVVALIDSGADVCFCSEDIAFWLGSNTKGKETRDFITANRGKFSAYKDIITLMVCGKIYECPFYISSELPRVTPIILGQDGFFNNFKITFDFKKKKINIT